MVAMTDEAQLAELKVRVEARLGDLVGGPCHDDHDCVEECVTGGDFPSGTCTVPCNDDHDCPSGTQCIGNRLQNDRRRQVRQMHRHASERHRVTLVRLLVQLQVRSSCLQVRAARLRWCRALRSPRALLHPGWC